MKPTYLLVGLLLSLAVLCGVSSVIAGLTGHDLLASRLGAIGYSVALFAGCRLLLARAARRPFLVAAAASVALAGLEGATDLLIGSGIDGLRPVLALVASALVAALMTVAVLQRLTGSAARRFGVAISLEAILVGLALGLPTWRWAFRSLSAEQLQVAPLLPVMVGLDLFLIGLVVVMITLDLDHRTNHALIALVGLLGVDIYGMYLDSVGALLWPARVSGLVFAIWMVLELSGASWRRLPNVDEALLGFEARRRFTVGLVCVAGLIGLANLALTPVLDRLSLGLIAAFLLVVGVRDLQQAGRSRSQLLRLASEARVAR